MRSERVWSHRAGFLEGRIRASPDRAVCTGASLIRRGSEDELMSSWRTRSMSRSRHGTHC